MDREQRRVEGLERFAVEEGLRDFHARYGAVKLAPVVALICAYEEADNIGDVLKAVPAEACGLPVAPLVIVDGGEDDTAKIALDAGAMTCVFPDQPGPRGRPSGSATGCAIDGGARYVVTLDADGQNDPGELPGHARAARRWLGRLRGGLPPARGRRDERPGAPDRGGRLRAGS